MPAYKLKVNGRERSVEAEAGDPLVAVLREKLELTGTKPGCAEGQCGSCTVLVGGAPVKSCITPIASVRGREIVTIEGLARGAQLHPLQQAFIDIAAFQCGYCTPGMIMRSAALLAETPRPSERQIREALEGNLCRCGTYPRIVQAVRVAAMGGRNG
jgi:aerobic-type carbon monoxide dehydrogenase small subunit (CoxS/CutS family)